MEFSTIQTTSAWDDWDRYGVTVEPDQSVVTLGATDRLGFIEPEPVLTDPPSQFDAVDIAHDTCGTLYILTASGTIYTYDAGTDRLDRLTCTPIGEADDEASAERARALCLTDETLYVATSATSAGESPGRVYAISRSLLQYRWVVELVDADPFTEDSSEETALETPRRLLAREDGVLVLDEAGFVAHIDADGRGMIVQTGLESPTDVAVGPDGRVYILEHPPTGPTVRVYEADQNSAETYNMSIVGAAPTESVSPACLCLASTDTLTIGVDSSSAGEQILFRYDAARGGFERLPTFRRACRRLLYTDTLSGRTQGRLYAIEAEGRQVFELTASVRNHRTVGGESLHDGRLIQSFDAGKPEIEWHRITTQVDLASAGTGLRVRYYATEDPEYRVDDLDTVANVGAVRAEQLRAANVTNSAELASLSVEDIAHVIGSTEHVAQTLLDGAEERVASSEYQPPVWHELESGNPADSLFDGAVGRYLWVELTLIGTAERSPTLDAFGLYFPRSSYLRYLPEIYGADEGSAAFLERFLSVFESEFIDIEARINATTSYLDPDGIPSQYLSWLGEWVALDLGETWSERAKRRFIRAAPRLFKLRGTRRGLTETLKIFLELDAEHRAGAADAMWDSIHAQERERLDALARAAIITATERETALETHAGLADQYSHLPAVIIYEGADLECLTTDRSGDETNAYQRLLCGSSCYVVFVGPNIGDDRMQTVKRLVEASAPVHATGRTVELTPRLELGGNTLLGVNSTLADPTFVSDQGGLGTDTVLSEREPFGQLDLKSTLGDDSVIS